MAAVTPPSNLKDPVARGCWHTLEMSARVHRGIVRNAKMAKDERLERYHHGYEEGLKKAMKIIVEKFGEE